MSSTTPDPVALAGPLTGSSASDEASRLTWAVRDTLAMTQRNLLHITRVPQLLVFTFIQPVMFVLLFRYVFGGSIGGSLPDGLDYVDFLLPGIFVQAVSFGATQAAVGLAEDLQGGIIDRFRSLPMARSAVLSGRTLADIVTSCLSLAIMIVVGLLVGFSFSAPPAQVAAGIGLMLLFGYAFSWIFAWIGLVVSTPEAANSFAVMIIFPLTFASSAFVPPETMPAGLRTFATDINPFSTMVDALRALFLDSPAGNDVWGAIAWCVGLIVVFGSLSVARYRRAVST